MRIDLERDVSKAVAPVIQRLTSEINRRAVEGEPVDLREAARWGQRSFEARELARALAEFAQAVTRPLEQRIAALEQRIQALEQRQQSGPPQLY